MPRTFFLAATLLATTSALAQSNTSPTIHTAADLQQLEAKTTEAAQKSPTGVSLSPIDDFGTYNSILVVRVKTGDSERHQFWADQMIVNKGTITLVTGGSMVGEHLVPNQPGETRGSAIKGGEEVVLHAGDVVHIPANVPHWVKIAPGTTTTYLIFTEK